MAMTRGDPSFRLACHGDYDAVMRMSEGIYEGTDYLPAFFHSYIDDPDVTVFLAAVGDQVVGLRASKFTESGTVFIVKAARVAPDWRGQGVDRKIPCTKRTLHRVTRADPVSGGDRTLPQLASTGYDRLTGMSCLFGPQTVTSVRLCGNGFLPKAWNGYEGEPVILVDWDPYNF
ncbi:NAT16 [Branchiostoma lanceolatum]|uniref:NAT16 protein n=1 Tax=Branchiostoma lanceolatum TaxID=7740 RepID=A0A8S4MN39_BRALA|nr:NAT16 [Branchiostoma lanceolatum]